MYKITDVVETGHFKFIGGTITISLFFENILDKNKKNKILEIIDHLDHCLITDNEDSLKYTDRYFLLKKCNNLFDDIFSILYKFIKEPIECEISIGKESCKKYLNDFSIVIDCNLEGWCKYVN